MTEDDPFGLSNDAGRTVIRPSKSQRKAGAQNYARAGAGGGTGRVRQVRTNDNPLIAAFAALMSFAPELERAEPPENSDTLRAGLLDNLIHARDSAVGQGVPLARADQAAWFVAALLDDIAINTPWGGHSDWPGHPLVVSLYGDVDAGERFFDRVEDLLRFPERDPEMLEHAYVCLSLGFRGKHRIAGASGEGALAQLRGSIARVLRHPDEDKAPLAPNWQGVEASDEPSRFALPLWTIWLGAAALVIATYIGLGTQLSNKGEQLYTLVDFLPPDERAEVFRPVRDSEPAPVIEINPVVLELLPLFAAAAPPETVDALTGREDVSLAIIVMQATDPEVFRSAKAEMNSEYQTLLASVAGVIKENIDVIGGIKVIGHTDSIPVQRSNPFASNQGLSEARADTIAGLLISLGISADLITSEGRAATRPIADNGSREGRARNRRVEIVLEKRI